MGNHAADFRSDADIGSVETNTEHENFIFATLGAKKRQFGARHAEDSRTGNMVGQGKSRHAFRIEKRVVTDGRRTPLLKV